LWEPRTNRKSVTHDKPTEQVSDFKYLGYFTPDYTSDLVDKLQAYNKLHGIIGRHFGKQVTKETKLRIHSITQKSTVLQKNPQYYRQIHSITDKAALKFDSEAWVLKKRDEKQTESITNKMFRHLLEINKFDRERNQSARDKLGVQNTVREIEQYQQKWLQHSEN
jgi:hypothetical protein